MCMTLCITICIIYTNHTIINNNNSSYATGKVYYDFKITGLEQLLINDIKPCRECQGKILRNGSWNSHINC